MENCVIIVFAPEEKVGTMKELGANMIAAIYSRSYRNRLDMKGIEGNCPEKKKKKKFHDHVGNFQKTEEFILLFRIYSAI